MVVEAHGRCGWHRKMLHLLAGAVEWRRTTGGLLEERRRQVCRIHVGAVPERVEYHVSSFKLYDAPHWPFESQPYAELWENHWDWFSAEEAVRDGRS